MNVLSVWGLCVGCFAAGSILGAWIVYRTRHVSTKADHQALLRMLYSQIHNRTARTRDDGDETIPVTLDESSNLFQV
jgi:hypothetical protein